MANRVVAFKPLRAACAAVSLVLAAGCQNEFPPSQVPVVAGPEADPSLYTPQLEADYHISPGDALLVNSYIAPSLKQQAVVQPDGRISLLLVGEILAADKTPKQLREELSKSYNSFLPGTDVSVGVTDIANQSIYIGGEVTKPSMQSARAQITLLSAITEAGGFTAGANRKQVLILRPGPTGRFQVVQQNVDSVLHNQAGEMYLRRHDVVYVPKSDIARVDQFVDQYINQIIPRTTQLIFGYQFLNQVNPSSSNVIIP